MLGTPLVWYGYVNSSLCGNITGFKYTTASMTSYPVSTLNQDGLLFACDCASTPNHAFTIWTQNKIDLTNYNSLVVGSTNYKACEMQYLIASTASYPPTTGGFDYTDNAYWDAVRTTLNSRQSLTLDVSGINASRSIIIQVLDYSRDGGQGTYGTCKIDYLYLM